MMRAIARTCRIFRRLRRDDRGISAVEFALLAPVMILLYFALSEFCQAYMAQKRAGHVNAIVGDIVAQNEVITGTQIDETFEISNLIMRPFPTTGLKQRVTSVSRRSNGQTRVDWSRASGMSALAANTIVDVPTDLIANGQAIILTEVDYDYSSPVDYLMPAVTKFTFKSWLRPRRSETISYTA